VVNTAEFIAFHLEFEDKKEEEMEMPVLQKQRTLKGFLKKEFDTEDVRQVPTHELKEKIEGEKMNKRSEYRKGFTNML